jgi:hypothetical protein
VAALFVETDKEQIFRIFFMVLLSFAPMLEETGHSRVVIFGLVLSFHGSGIKPCRLIGANCEIG